MCALLCTLRLQKDSQKRNDEHFVASTVQTNGVPSRIYRYQPFSVAKMIYRWPNFKLCINWRCLFPMGIFLILFHHHRNVHVRFVYILFGLFSLCLFLQHDISSIFFPKLSNRKLLTKLIANVNVNKLSVP